MSVAWLNRRNLAWSSYDVASSVFVGLVPAVLMPVYVRQLITDGATATAAWGTLAAVALLASGLAALAAASATRKVRRFRLLAVLTLGLLVSMAALAFNPSASLPFAAVAYVAALAFGFAATAIYESFLPDLLPPAARQKLSGFGWAIGYAGGILGIAALLFLIGGRPESAGLVAQCFGVLLVISAVLFAAAFMLMRREGFDGFIATGETRRLSGVISVLMGWRAHRTVHRLLAGTMLVQMVVSVVVVFTAPILAARFGQTLPDLLWLLLVVHVMSVPSTFLWNAVMSRRSRLVPMTVLLLAWGCVLLLLAAGSGAWMPLATVTAIGCCLGGTLSALRGFLAEIVEPSDSAAFFGVATVVGRIATALGPALFSVATLVAGQTAALLIMLLVLLAGGALILRHLARAPLVEQDAVQPAGNP